MAGKITNKIAAILGMIFLLGIVAVIVVAVAKILVGL